MGCTQEQRQHRNALARARYANNESTRERYRSKARARIPVKCEYEKRRRRKEAKEQGRKFREPGDVANKAERLMMEAYTAEKNRVARMDRMWTKHIVAMRHAGALSAKEQWSRRKHEPGYRQIKALRHRLWTFVKSGKRNHMRELIGCSNGVLRRHLENAFHKGMTWENYGEWEIDHIVPCTAFDLMDKQEQMRCFHFSNLQPLWKHDNRRKSATIRDTQQELLIRIA